MNELTNSLTGRVAAEIDADPDCGILLKEVARHLPKRNGHYMNYSTVWRWATKGFRTDGVGSARVVLETTLIGRYRYTSRQALRRFNRARNFLAGQRRGADAQPQLTGRAAERFLTREGFNVPEKQTA